MRIIDFEVYKDLLQEKAGLLFTEHESSLLETRLSPIAKKWGYASLSAMTMALHGVPEDELVDDVVEAIVSRDTSFFFDTQSFLTFQNDVLPYIKKTHPSKKTLRIWCAGAASGQEAYTVSIALKEMEQTLGLKPEILATDISARAIEQTRKGRYSQAEVQLGLPIQLLVKHFTQNSKGWQVNKDIRKPVTYQKANLLEPVTYPESFDIIFCRNLLPSLTQDAKNLVFENITNNIELNGFLFLDDDTQSVTSAAGAFKPVPGTPGLYIPEGSAYSRLPKTDTQALA